MIELGCIRIRDGGEVGSAIDRIIEVILSNMGDVFSFEKDVKVKIGAGLCTEAGSQAVDASASSDFPSSSTARNGNACRVWDAFHESRP